MNRDFFLNVFKIILKQSEADTHHDHSEIMSMNAAFTG